MPCAIISMKYQISILSLKKIINHKISMTFTGIHSHSYLVLENEKDVINNSSTSLLLLVQ